MTRPALLTVQPTTSITLGDAVFEVERMSNEIKQMVAYFDAWRQKEVDLQSDILQVRGALQNLQNQLVAAIQKEREDAVKKAEALGVVPPATPPVAEQAAPAPAPAAKRSRK